MSDVSVMIPPFDLLAFFSLLCRFLHCELEQRGWIARLDCTTVRPANYIMNAGSHLKTTPYDRGAMTRAGPGGAELTRGASGGVTSY